MGIWAPLTGFSRIFLKRTKKNKQKTKENMNLDEGGKYIWGEVKGIIKGELGQNKLFGIWNFKKKINKTSILWFQPKNWMQASVTHS